MNNPKDFENIMQRYENKMPNDYIVLTKRILKIIPNNQNSLCLIKFDWEDMPYATFKAMLWALYKENKINKLQDERF